jgi:hypothetical protein
VDVCTRPDRARLQGFPLVTAANNQQVGISILANIFIAINEQVDLFIFISRPTNRMRGLSRL